MFKCLSVSTRMSALVRRFAGVGMPASFMAAAALVVSISAPNAGARQAVDDDAMVAVYDGGGVTVGEFKSEYRKAAAKYAGYDMTGYKNDLLVQMLTNELMAREAAERGFVDENGEWDPRVIAVKEKAMVNQLRRDVIVKGITVKEEDVKRLYDLSNVRRLTRTISVGNKNDAGRVIEELENGADIAKLAADWSLDLGSARWDAILAWVKIGDAPEDVENLIMGLELGEIGGPIETNEGYYIFRVDSLYYKDDLPEYEEMRPLLRSKALARKRTPVNVAFMDSVAKARGVTYDDDTIQIVIDRFQREGWVQDDVPGRDAKIPDFTPEELSKPIFTFEGGSHPLDEYIQYIDDEAINPAYYLAGREEIERGLRGLVRTKLEILAAYEMGMDKVPSVRGQVRNKASNLGVVDMLVDVAGGEESTRTTEEDHLAFYEENKWKYTKPGAIVISVLTVNTMEVVDQLFADMTGGLPFAQLVDDYRWVMNEDFTTERMELTSKDEEDNPEIFNTARRMKVGAVSEPIPLGKDVGFAVIKLLEREPSSVIPYEDVKNEVKVDLNLQILNAATEKIESFKQSIREKYHYQVNEEILQSIEL